MLAADMILARRKKIFAVSPSPCSAGACACPRWEGGLAPTPGSPSHEGLVGKNSAFSGNFGTWLTCNLKRAPDAACLRQQRPATAQATCFALGCSNYLLIDKGLPTGTTAQLQNKPTSSLFGVGQPCNSPGNLFRTWLLKLLAHRQRFANWIHSTAAKHTRQLLLRSGATLQQPRQPVSRLAARTICSSTKVCQLDPQHSCKTNPPAPSSGGATLQRPRQPVSHLAAQTTCSPTKVCPLDPQHSCKTNPPAPSEWGNPATAQATCFALGCSNYLLIDKGLPTGSTAQLQNTLASSFFGAGQPWQQPKQPVSHLAARTTCSSTKVCQLDPQHSCKTNPPAPSSEWGNPATAQATCFALGCSNYLLGLCRGQTTANSRAYKARPTSRASITRSSSAHNSSSLLTGAGAAAAAAAPWPVRRIVGGVNFTGLGQRWAKTAPTLLHRRICWACRLLEDVHACT